MVSRARGRSAGLGGAWDDELDAPDEKWFERTPPKGTSIRDAVTGATREHEDALEDILFPMSPREGADRERAGDGSADYRPDTPSAFAKHRDPANRTYGGKTGMAR